MSSGYYKIEVKYPDSANQSLSTYDLGRAV